MDDFRQPAFRAHGRQPLPRSKARRPFALRQPLRSFSTYDSLIRHIMRKASRAGLVRPQIPEFEKSLREISSSIERLRIGVGNNGRPGNKKAALCLVSEIALCYRDPVQAIRSLSASYSLILKMADRVREGRLRQPPDTLEKRAAQYGAIATLLCSVSGLRQLRRDALNSGNPGESTHPLPEISNPALVGYVSVQPSLLNGKGVDSRRLIAVEPAEGEKMGDYSRTIALITKRLSSVDRTNAVWFRTSLEEIAGHLSAIPFGVDKRRLLCLIAETCLLYREPSKILEGFRGSYAVLDEIAKTAGAGKKFPLVPGKEREAEDFARRVRRFGSLHGLTGIRANASLGMNGNGSTYEIEFVTMHKFREISYGRGPEAGQF